MAVLSKLTRKPHNDYWKKVKEINTLESTFELMSDQDLKDKSQELKQRIQGGEPPEQCVVEAFALIRETSERVLGLRHFDVQLLAGISLFEGNISEMPTGEGKTLVASCPAYLRALEGKGVHVITVNDYLAKRDFELIGQIHTFLGLTVSLNIPGMTPEEKSKAYQADITYGVGVEFGFDYLRDNLAQDFSQKVQRPYHYAIIDEIDSVLIDEARTPLIIAGKTEGSKGLYNVCAKVASNFKQDTDFTFDPELKIVTLTDDGINKVEKIFAIDDLYALEHRTLNHFIMQAIRARILFERDVDYIVDEGIIKLVDMNTGRVMEGRSLSDGLHQAIEAKEGLHITDINKVNATITIQNYYSKYPILSGMTGTAKTEEAEFQKVYGTEVKVIPTNKPIVRKDLPDQLYLTKEQKYQRIVDEVKKSHAIGRPVLIGTTSILQSEQVAVYLEKAGLTFELLNAKSVEQEVRLISLAGQKNQITIATNMAGRGTDIMLGEGVKELGGLHVIGTEKHESRRIDNQLKGRSGRQGDPGLSQFIVSLEDDLFIRYAGEDIEKYVKKFKVTDLGLINEKQAHKFIERTQKIAEGSHYQVRESNMKLEGVVFEQQKVIYHLRDSLMMTENTIQFITRQVDGLFEEVIQDLLGEGDIEQQDKKRTQYLLEKISIEPLEDNILEQSQIDLVKLLREQQKKQTEVLMSCPFDDESQVKMKRIMLMLIDRYWINHLDDLTRMKEGSHLRSYEQEDPVQIFIREAFQLFTEMFKQLKTEVTANLIQLYHETNANNLQ